MNPEYQRPLKRIGQFALEKMLSNRKDKDLERALKLKALMDMFPEGSEFREDFILPNVAEQIFYMRTGIDVDYKLIRIYIDLKKRVGYGIKWATIALAEHGKFLKCVRGKLVVSISRSAKISYNIKITTAFLLWTISMSCWGFFGFTLPIDGPPNERFLSLGISSIPFIGGTIMLLSPGITRMIAATVIERRLKKHK